MAAMACLSTASVVTSRITASASSSTTTSTHSRLTAQFATRRPRSVALRAGNSSGVEPDLEEDFRNIHQTLGEDNEDNFPYGKADGAHSWHEGDDGTWWEGIKEVFETSGGPVGAQGAISWLFIPGLIAGFLFNVNPDYLYIYTVLFIFAFIGMEMAKPSKPSHFEPDMYKLKK
ncbi:hypothetical protein M758_8G034100 [Ceratodon purpureus]|nr:hypothetical protein M758_8G034100 [Ceratodon purpureus]